MPFGKNRGHARKQDDLDQMNARAVQLIHLHVRL